MSIWGGGAELDFYNNLPITLIFAITLIFTITFNAAELLKMGELAPMKVKLNTNSVCDTYKTETKCNIKYLLVHLKNKTFYT